MADAKIDALTNYTPAISTDVLPIVDVTLDITKKITTGNLLKDLSTSPVELKLSTASKGGVFNGGFELGTGLTVNIKDPSEAARELLG